MKNVMFVLLFVIPLMLSACQANDSNSFTTILKENCNYGVTSWYGKDFHGKKTHSGEVYDMNAMTCAVPLHFFTRTTDYPLGTILQVTNLANGKTVVVRVNDTGSFGWKYGRQLDLSKGAFEQIEDLDKGLAKVKIRVIV